MRLQLSFRQRTLLGFGLMVFLVLVASGAGLFYARAVDDTIDTTQTSFDDFQRISDLRLSWVEVVAAIDNMLLTRQASLGNQRVLVEMDEFEAELTNLRGQNVGSDTSFMSANQDLLGQLQPLGNELTDIVNQLVFTAQENSWARAQILRHTELASLQRRLDTILAQLGDNLRQDVDQSVDNAVATQNTSQNAWGIISVLAVLLGVAAAYFTVRSTMRPIRSLASAAHDIRSGQLTRRAEVTSQDEIGQLAETFNSMAQQINEFIDHLEERVVARTRDLQTAAEVSRQITTVLDIDALLQEVVRLTAVNYNLYASFVYLPSEDGATLTRAAGADASGQPLNTGPETLALDAKPSLIAQAARTRQPVLANDVLNMPGYMPWHALPATRSELVIPMQIGSRLVGIFDLQAARPDRFTDDDRRVLGTLAEQVAVAVRNADLFAQAAAAREAAEQANRVKSQFLANMSHELRTPLNAILNFTGFVADGVLGPVNDTQSESLNKVMTSGEHLLSLINDILDLTKIEVGMMDLFIQDVDMNEALRTMLATTKGLIKDKDIVIQTEIDENLPVMQGDRRRIRQVLLNLVSNAVKFTPKGTVTIRAHADGDLIRLAVADTGIGIAEDQQPLVFESFRQAKHELPDTPGTGLGMPITKAFVEAHGGRIWLESALGAGTTFHIELPINPPQIEAADVGRAIKLNA